MALCWVESWRLNEDEIYQRRGCSRERSTTAVRIKPRTTGNAEPNTVVASAPWRRIFQTPSVMSYDHELFHVRLLISHVIGQS